MNSMTKQEYDVIVYLGLRRQRIIILAGLECG